MSVDAPNAPEGPDAPAPAAPGRRRLSPRAVAVALVLMGVLALLYPVVVTHYNNERHREFSERYRTQIDRAAPERLQSDFTRAREYNRGIDGIPILDPWLSKVSELQSSRAYQSYLGQLDAVDAMARVRVPAAGIDLPVRHGTGEESITTGAGHLYGTSLPVGGVGTHAVLTSHTGMGTATLFDHLADVTEGDLVFVDVAGQTLAYRVDRISVVLPHEIEQLTPVNGRDYLTLFTCTPYAVNTHRLLVRAERVAYFDVADADVPAPAVVMEPWMWWMLGGASVGLVVAGVLLRRRPDDDPARSDEKGDTAVDRPPLPGTV